MEKYSALLIDLKRSRTYNQIDRSDIQKYIKLIITSLNNLFANAIKFDVVFSGGDEIQGLFYSSEAAYLYFRLFNMLIFPVEVRAGIGVGEWSIKIDSKNSTEQDGPAFHNARYAINNIEDSLDYSILIYSKNENDIYINSVINNATLFESKQSEYQNELFLLTELMYPINVKNLIETNKIKKIKELISLKKDFNFYSNLKLIKNIKQHPFRFIKNINFECTPVEAIAVENDFYISSGKIKGLPKLLSNLLGISRQTIEKSIRSANIYQARNSAIIALRLIKKYISEDD